MRGGYIAAIVIASLTLVATPIAGCGLAIWGAVEGVAETDVYGRVTVPGKAKIQFPEGEVTVYYEGNQFLSLDGDDLKNGRQNILLSVVSSDGTPVDLKGRGSVDEEVTEGDATRVNFDRIEIPEAGTYLVTAKKAGKVRGDSLTFGTSLSLGMVDRAKDALWGLLGFVLAAAIALATLLTGQRGRDETIQIPTDGNLPGQYPDDE